MESYLVRARMALLALVSGLVFLHSVTATVNQPGVGIESLIGGGPLKELLSESGLKSELENFAKKESAGGGLPLLNKLSKNTGSTKLVVPVGVPVPMSGTMKKLPLKAAGKLAKVAIPLKKVAVKKAATAKVLAPKFAVPIVAMKAKPKVHKLKPIIHIVEKPVPVFHKVPVPKKVIVPKFYPVYKPIPVPKIIPVPFKVPIKKIIPKIVKIPKAIPVPKFYPVKKPIPIGIPYPVPKFHKVPVPKLVPYKKYIPIPIPKKVPKFIPVPVKKIIKVPKPYYVPVKVPHITTSYVKTPMVVRVPHVKKVPSLKGGKHRFPFGGGGGMNYIKADDEDEDSDEDSEEDSDD